MKKKLYINISTRLLLYFLVITILPLAIISLSSTFLINNSLNEKSDQELSENIDSIRNEYYKTFDNYKKINDSFNMEKISTLLEDVKTDNINQYLKNIKEKYHLNFAVLLDKNFKPLNSVSDSSDITFYPIATNTYKSLEKVLHQAQKGKIVVSSEIFHIQDVSFLNLQNKVFLRKTNKGNNKQYGLLTQIGVIPVYPGINIENIKASKNQKEKLPETDYLILVGNFINSNYSAKELAINSPNIFFNIIQLNEIIASNNKKLFNIENINLSNIKSLEDFQDEQFIDNEWYKIKAMPIVNYQGQTISLFLIGIKDDIFRSLKFKNSLLMLEVSILIGIGGLILAFLFTKNITTPIDKMIKTVKNIEKGESTNLLDITGEDELAKLADSINNMAVTLDMKQHQINEYNKILLDQKTKLETIFNYSTDGIMTVDKNKKIVSINPAIINWTEKTEEFILGKYYYEIINFIPEPIHIPTNTLNIESIENLELLNKIYKNEKINNIDVEISYSPIKLDKESEINYVLIIRDITKRKETEEIRENFIATLTHDLRVPLIAGVHTLNYLLKGSYGDISDKQKYILEQVISSNEDLLRMVNNLLDTYVYEEGKHSLVIRDININKLIQECINELEHLAKDKSHQLFFDNKTPTYFVKADKQEIKRVITNLISNAIIHTSEGGEIKVYLEENNEFLNVNIKDNGVGLSEKEKKEIFQRYSKGGKTLRKVGTGLGLYLSKFIIEAHNGRINVESKLKEGSIFTFTLLLSKKVLEKK